MVVRLAMESDKICESWNRDWLHNTRMGSRLEDDAIGANDADAIGWSGTEILEGAIVVEANDHGK